MIRRGSAKTDMTLTSVARIIAVAIEDIGASRGNGIGGRAFDTLGRVRPQTEIDELGRDDPKDRDEIPKPRA